jgi:hypothetical protein
MDDILFAALSFSQIMNRIDTPDEARDGGFHYIIIVASKLALKVNFKRNFKEKPKKTC